MRTGTKIAIVMGILMFLVLPVLGVGGYYLWKTMQSNGRGGGNGGGNGGNGGNTGSGNSGNGGNTGSAIGGGNGGNGGNTGGVIGGGGTPGCWKLPDSGTIYYVNGNGDACKLTGQTQYEAQCGPAWSSHTDTTNQTLLGDVARESIPLCL